MLGPRPTAIRTFSASKAWTSPLVLRQTTLAPTGLSSTDSTGQDKQNRTPIFFMCLRPMAVRSPIQHGQDVAQSLYHRHLGAEGRIGTGQLRPMTPPPMTTMVSGSFSRERAPVESMQLGFSLMPGMGGTALTEPVARIILSQARVCSAPSAGAMRSCLGPMKGGGAADPLDTVGLQQACHAAGELLAYAVLLAMTWGKSTRMLSARTPKLAPCVRSS